MMEPHEARENELLAQIEVLEDTVADLKDDIQELQSNLKEYDAGAELKDLPVQECIRCHRAFTGPVGQKWCTHDCRMGWTPAPTYLDWYASMHPRSKWLRYGQ